MKKFLSLIVLVLCATWQVDAKIASGTLSTGLAWEITDDGVLTVSGEGEIPAYKTTELAPWNSYKKQVVKVVVSDGVTVIGNYSFYSMSYVKELVIGADVKNINANAFSYCSALGSIEWYGSSVTVKSTAFNQATGGVLYYTSAATLPAFFKNKFTTVLFEPETEFADGLWWSLRDGVLTISGSGEMPDYELSDDQPWVDVWDYITSVVVEEGITAVGTESFSGIYTLETVALPASLTKIGVGAFSELESLSVVEFAEGNKAFTTNGEVVLSDGGKTLLFAYNGFSEIPATVTKIESKAFYGFGDRLVSIVIPANVESIGDMAFKGCYALIKVNAKRVASAPVLGVEAFDEDAKELAELWLDVEESQLGIYSSWNEYFGGGVFSTVNIATSGTITNGSWEFASESGVLTVACTGEMDDFSAISVTDAPWGSLSEKITSVVIEEGCTYVGDFAFFGCFNIKSITLPSTVETVGFDAFNSSSKVNVVLSSNAYIDETAFGSGATLNLTLNGDGTQALGLNENEFASVKLNRAFKAGGTGTIVLPFVPKGVTGLHYYQLGEATDGGIYFNEVVQDAILPNMPYIWHNTGNTDITQLTAVATDGVVAIAPEDAISSKDDSGVWEMIGTFDKEYITTGLSTVWAYTSGKFKNYKNSLTVNPYRAYFVGRDYNELFPNSSDAALSANMNAALSVILVDTEGTTTAIEGIEMDENGALDFSGAREQGVYYDLSGRRIDNPTRGIYILNGKKVLVK